jgi:hypothetical protein
MENERYSSTFSRDSLRNSLVQQLDHVQDLLIGVVYFDSGTHLQQAARI